MSSFLENLSRQGRNVLEEAGKVAKEIRTSAGKVYNAATELLQEADPVDLFLSCVSVAPLVSSFGTAFRNRFAPQGSSPLERAFYQQTNSSREVIKSPPYLQDDILVFQENKTYFSDATLINRAIYTYQSIVEESDLVKNSGGIFSPFRQEILGSFTRVTEEETFVTYAAFVDQSGVTEAQCTTTITQVSEEVSVGRISIPNIATPISSTHCILIDDSK